MLYIHGRLSIDLQLWLSATVTNLDFQPRAEETVGTNAYLT